MSGRLVVDDVSPEISSGRHPAKAVVGEHIPVAATVWREGHDAVAATLVWRGPEQAAAEIRMAPGAEGSDRWHATAVADREGEWTFRVDAWSDPWTTWRHAVAAKLAAGQGAAELANDLVAGAALLDRAARRHARRADRPLLRAAAVALRREDYPLAQRVEPALSAAVGKIMHDCPVRELVTRGTTHRIWVDREPARMSAWYELFPRSTGGVDSRGEPVHGTFATAAGELDRIADMGFDVLYLPPIHPIGEVNRKGRNNSVTAEPGDVGSPWAIGSRAGGHDAVHPDLGTVADFRRFVDQAAARGLEVALDLALQCAPDHPWVAEHPEWFTTLADGTIAYAENPPKKYQDIYPLNFDNDPEGLRAEILRVVLRWIDRGVRIFRVDNPHTKPPDFWHWLIWQVKAEHPDVLFLAEAFTRPARMHGLSKLGFTQHYTYFTWRTGKQELTEFGESLVEHADEGTPNLFVNTPDILHESLQHGGPAMFALRAALAATLSPSWGVYSGYELFEHEAVRPGSEEYLDSEKYELRPRDYRRALAEGRSLQPWLTRLNEIRREHPALRQLRTLRFHEVDNDALIAYSKTDPATGHSVVCVVTLDPDQPQDGTVTLDLAALGLPEDARFTALDAVSGDIFDWGAANYVKLDPRRAVAHIVAVGEQSVGEQSVGEQ
ncbi:maltotransferase domain-containing protein [Actinokineospora iranica]|uniref:Alpha-1,4-glucan:maltose-1-phosphate maltosyltransferase n=1 Tax=Actinokineospora iranica TaxID=1271860 RepID=A0A1G6QG54_9PSEU|nr:maltotransferase domain-containing protein [Actinokineospora iranica]SDC90894.1 alpha-1,4-glucan:maltose-1-phosphate maltosyltransferase [Actinokineospora iranica]